MTAAILYAAVRARARRLATWAARTPPTQPLCVCGHPEDAHRHLRPGSDCGACGADVCPRYRPADLHAVCADDQVINAVLADDIDYALLIATPEFVGLLAALADTGRRR